MNKFDEPIYEYVPLSDEARILLKRQRIAAFKKEYDYCTKVSDLKNLYIKWYNITFTPEELQYYLDLSVISQAILDFDDNKTDTDWRAVSEAVKRCDKYRNFLDISEIKIDDD